MFGFGILGAANGDHLDLGELVLTDQTARIAPRRPGLGPEAGRQRRQTHRLGHLLLGQDLLPNEVGQGDLGGGDEEKLQMFSSFRIKLIAPLRKKTREDSL
ncbi:hypothetical protein D3C73_1059970 [compost metagenome]